MITKRLLFLFCIVIMAQNALAQQRMDDAFRQPPTEAKPIMIWQWMDGLVSAEGITADLEAYQQAGIGGVQQFLVGGPVQVSVCDSANAIGTDSWRRLMQHAISECSRLGLSFGSHNCPGWSSSAFPTVAPAYSMQKLVWTKESMPRNGLVRLPKQPEVDAQWNYYEDIAVLVMPDDSLVSLGDIHVFRPSELPTRLRGVGDGYCVVRFGHTTNGKTNYATAPVGGVGLECDKMSREAVRRYWDTYPQQLLFLAGSEAGKTFQRLEIDSYEAGGQEWTRRMPEEFEQRRGYALLPWLPTLTGLAVVDSPEATLRVRRDWQETVSDLFAENYYGYMSQLAHEHGLKLLVQPYGTGSAKPFNPINTQKIVRQVAPDDPICAEFWAKPDSWGWKDVPRVASAAHSVGHEEVWAEGFTCWPLHAWRDDPAALKATADRAFCLGVNRVMLHAAAQNPWPQAKPGMTFGMWGTWWTPGQTWWRDGATALFTYIARCQSLLQRGSYVDNFQSRERSMMTDNERVQWIHRRDNGADIYFIANTNDSTLVATLTINDTGGRVPETWDADTGEMAKADAWTAADGKTKVKLRLTAHQSLFLVFRERATEAPSALALHEPVVAESIPVNKAWTVKFFDAKQVEWQQLTPWNESADHDIKYFSGTARYTQHLCLSEVDRHYRYVLDLGEVKNMAVVRVNGLTVGTLWHPPFSIDISDALLGGDNTLEIDVTNLWVNRMVGDELEPDDVEWSDPVGFGAAQSSPGIGRAMKRVPEWLSKGLPRPSRGRKAIVSFKFFSKDTPLLRSGMIGPVVLTKQQEGAACSCPSVEQELRIKHGGKNIYGVLSTPVDGRRRHPIVIYSHGFNGTHHHGRSYFKMLREIGYMCFTFDFPCGSTGSRSDNNTINMSVLDEQKALEAIVGYFKKRPDVDKDNIVLVGGSQGGLVAALTAASMKRDIRRLVLEFPALCIPDNWSQTYPQTASIPDTTKVWQVPIGRRFFMELRDIDVDKAMEAYRRPVLIVHGDADNVVPIGYSRRAVERYHDARLMEIPGAGHGFNSRDFEKALKRIRQFLTGEDTTTEAIINGVPWYDQNGNVVNAHGAGITYDHGRYWLFGEYKADTTNAFLGFSCYSSADLTSWHFERVVLPVQNDGILGPNRVGERVKVMKCPKTGQYVMLMHADALDYADPYIGIATSPTINGNYQLRGVLSYQGKPIKRWDMGVFQDDDGKGYLLIHHGPIYRLSDDYLTVDTLVAQVKGMGESPAMFKKDGIYYLLTSNTTSWERNDNYYFTAPSPAGPWTRQGTFCPEGTLTWNSQTTFVLTLPDGTPMYMGDRWSYPHQASAATYVWLPLQAEGPRLSIPNYWNAWDVQTVSPVQLLENSRRKTVNFSSNMPGKKVVIPFRGKRIIVTGQANTHGGYARLTIRRKDGTTVRQALIDCYAKTLEQGICYASPILPEGSYLLEIEVTGDKGNWTDKRHNTYGADDCYVNVSSVYYE